MTAMRDYCPEKTRRPASPELSDAEIITAYGPVLQSALQAYRADPTYLVDMMEKARLILSRREASQAARIVKLLPRVKTPEERRAEVDRVLGHLHQRGILIRRLKVAA